MDFTQDNTAQENIERLSTDSIIYKDCEITFDQLHHEYGPEGLYEIANKLKEIADNDVYDTMKKS